MRQGKGDSTLDAETLVARAATELGGDPFGPPIFVVVPAHLTLSTEGAVLRAAHSPGSFRLRVVSVGRFARALLGLLSRPAPEHLSQGEFRSVVQVLATSRFKDIVESFRGAAHGATGALADDMHKLLQLGSEVPVPSSEGPLLDLLGRLWTPLREIFGRVAPEPELMRLACDAVTESAVPPLLVFSSILQPTPIYIGLLEALRGRGAVVKTFAVARIFSGPAPGPNGGLTVREGVRVESLRAIDPGDEASRVALRCRELLRLGADPSDIAVGCADEGMHEVLRRALCRAGVPATPLEALPIRFSALCGGLLELASGRAPRASLTRVVESGLLTPSLDERDPLLSALRGQGSIEGRMPERLRQLMAQASGWPITGTLRTHFAHFFDWLQALGVADAVELAGGADAEMYAALADAARRIAAGTGDLRVGQATATTTLLELSKVAKPSRSMPPLGTVRVGPLADLVGDSAEHVLLCGLDEGHFPMHRGRGVLPEEMFDGTCFSWSAELELAREEARLALLAARSTLHLSYAQRSADAEQQAATGGIWADGVWPPGEAVAPAGPEGLLQGALSRQELGRAVAVVLSRLRDLERDPRRYGPLVRALRDVPGGEPPLAGFLRQHHPESVEFVLSDPARFSVTALERRAQCSFRWFATDVLRLGPEEDPDAFDPLQQGSLVHDILARLEGVDFTPAELQAWVDAQVEEAVEEGDHPTLRGDGAGRTLRQHLQREILRIAQMVLAERRQSRFTTVARELPVEIPLLVDGREVRIRGRIDRLDRSEGGWLRVVDYKVRTRQHFDITHFYHGLDLQAGSYGLWLSGPESPFEGRLGALAYWPMRPARESGEGPPPGDAAQAYRKRHPVGLHLEDAGLGADLGGPPFSPLRIKKDGEVAQSPTAIDETQWPNAMARVQEVLAVQVGGALRGEVGPDPYRLPGRAPETACDRCDLRAMCGFLPEAGDRYRALPRVDKEVF